MKAGLFFKELTDLFFPRLCPICRQALNRGEEGICTTCLHRLPRTGYHRDPFSPMAQLFLGKVPIERCAAFFFFTSPGDARQLIHHIKYHGGKQCGSIIGEIYAHELLPSGFFDGIDALVPVPLHPSKLRHRGYNQCEWIAAGIERATGIEQCSDWLYHTRNTRSQTRKGIYDRWLDTHRAYETAPDLDLSRRHILLIDDVVTTGATLLACAQALYTCGNPRISCLTLAAAQ